MSSIFTDPNSFQGMLFGDYFLMNAVVSNLYVNSIAFAEAATVADLGRQQMFISSHAVD